jgi:DNA (cytosine-5)-methyltransferase 1
MANLQTFPSNVVFIGVRRSVQAQIGNAVPSLMAEVLATEIAEQLFGVKTKSALSFAILPKRPIPPPEPVQPVPLKYLDLIGDHPDHPGTGKGRSRVRRES